MISPPYLLYVVIKIAVLFMPPKNPLRSNRGHSGHIFSMWVEVDAASQTVTLFQVFKNSLMRFILPLFYIRIRFFAKAAGFPV